MAETQTCKACNQSWPAEPLQLLRFCPACGQLAMTPQDYAIFSASLFAASFAFFFVVFDLLAAPSEPVAPPPAVAQTDVVEEPAAVPSVVSELPPLPEIPEQPDEIVVPVAEPEPTDPAPEEDPPVEVRTPPAAPSYQDELESFYAYRPQADDALKQLMDVNETRSPSLRIAQLESAMAVLGSARSMLDALLAHDLDPTVRSRLGAIHGNISQALAWAGPLLEETRAQPLAAIDRQAAQLRQISIARELELWEELSADPDFAAYQREISDRRDALRDQLAGVWDDTERAVAGFVQDRDFARATSMIEAFADYGLASYDERVAAALADVRAARDAIMEELADEVLSRVKRWLSARKRLKCNDCGGDSWKKCSKCRGTGRLTVISLTGGSGQQSTPCNRCEGSARRPCEECEAGLHNEKAQELIEEYGGRALLVKKDRRSSIEVSVSEDLRSATVQCELKYGDEDEYQLERSAWQWDAATEEWMVLP